MATVSATDPVAELDRHLEASACRFGFDMDDQPDLPLLEAFPRIRDGLSWLDEHVGTAWRGADAAALTHQARHRTFARIAVAAGVAAIVLAILQLALGQILPELTHPAAWLEATAVIASIIAVGLGLWAKADRNWLSWRHRAEQLRMLKFRALLHPQLLQGQLDEWKQWAMQELSLVPVLATLSNLEGWSRDDTPRVEDSMSGDVAAGDDERRALVVYFRHKRLLNQADYFDRQGNAAAAGWIPRLRHHRELLFFLTISSVFFHFAAEYVSGRFEETEQTVAAYRWHVAALVGVTMAAVLPVFGLGVRAWSGVFEQSRKARTFDAKRRAMLGAASVIQAAENNWQAAISRLRTDERFLEMEHREWLRLMLDAEWFL